MNFKAAIHKNNFVFGFGLALLVTAAVAGIMYILNLTVVKLIFGSSIVF